MSCAADGSGRDGAGTECAPRRRLALVLADVDELVAEVKQREAQHVAWHAASQRIADRKRAAGRAAAESYAQVSESVGDGCNGTPNGSWVTVYQCSMMLIMTGHDWS